MQNLQIALQRSEKPNEVNKTRGGTGGGKSLPVTAGHCHPATPAHVFLLSNDIRPHWATIGRTQMTRLEQSFTAPPSATSSALLQGWISRTDLAQELGVCDETLRRWADARRGPAFVKAGRKILYRRSVVLDWLETQEDMSPRRARAGGRR